MKNRYLAFLLVLILGAHLAYAGDKAPTIINAEIFGAAPYDITYGSETAPIQVLEYFSLTCPHCAKFYEDIFPLLKKEYIDTGKVRWVKRSFITDSNALSGTMLLNCVDTSKKESYLKILFSKQSNWAYQKDAVTILKNIASLGGMSGQDFAKCMSDKTREKSIINISNQAKDILKVSGTPAFYIDQNSVSIFSHKSFKEYLDKLLLEKK